ncbi:MAG TPA: glycosyltransferase family 2 protein [Candidatus Woesebacteria bacterium]|nr:glycosyltransferase family 2 protein [Candidatus Woesebacteria bacterium]
MKLTVVIPTLNEEKDLYKTLESIKNLADEVLVIDSGSTDRTIEIAKTYGAKTIHHPFTSFSETRNFGNEQAIGDWILSIEADVYVTKELAEEIRQAIVSEKVSAYFIPRLNLIWGKPIYHTDWGPKDDCHIWLYKKGSGKWQSLVHEEYVTDMQTGKLKNFLIHKNYETIFEFIEKIDRYSNLAVKQKQFFSNWWFLRDFIKRYFYKLGFLDGYHGLFLSYLQAVYYLTLSVKKRTYEKTR